MKENHHHHHHHVEVGEHTTRLFVFCILLNLLFVGVEAGVGLWQHSLSLLSDAGHNLSDVFSLLLVLVAVRLAKVKSNRHFTYGYKKSTVLISLLNAIILLVAVGAIIIESLHKFREPAEVNGMAVSWTAGAGIIINGLTAIMLMRSQKADLNVRGAFLHMVADTLVSVGVVFSGIIISVTGWNVIDPIVSLLVAVIILFSTWNLLADSLRLSLDGLPEGINLDEIEKKMRRSAHVADIHHVHIWAISTTENALTAHIVIDQIDHMEEVKAALKAELEELNITHSTLEFETQESHCHEHDC